MGVRRKNHFAESAACTAADTTVEMLALTLALAGVRGIPGRAQSPRQADRSDGHPERPPGCSGAL